MRILPLALAAAACGPPPTAPTTPGARGPRASEHLDAAREHDQRAHDLSMWPDLRRESPAYIDPAGLWYRRWDTVQDEQRFARIHRGEAARLQAAYEDACGARPLAEIQVSPLQRYGVGQENTENGALVFLDPSAGEPDELMAALRCHRAWMMLGPNGMADCPLDLDGIEIEARGNDHGITVGITARDPRVISEVQRRVARDLEARRR